MLESHRDLVSELTLVYCDYMTRLYCERRFKLDMQHSEASRLADHFRSAAANEVKRLGVDHAVATVGEGRYRQLPGVLTAMFVCLLFFPGGPTGGRGCCREPS